MSNAALAARLGSAPEDFPLPLYVVDPLGRVVFCNRALAQLVGASPDELLGKPSLLLYPAEAVPALLRERVHALIGDAAPSKLRTHIHRRNGHGALPVELAVAHLDEGGTITGFIVIVSPTS